MSRGCLRRNWDTARLIELDSQRLEDDASIIKTALMAIASDGLQDHERMAAVVVEADIDHFCYLSNSLKSDIDFVKDAVSIHSRLLELAKAVLLSSLAFGQLNFIGPLITQKRRAAAVCIR